MPIQQWQWNRERNRDSRLTPRGPWGLAQISMTGSNARADGWKMETTHTVQAGPAKTRIRNVDRNKTDWGGIPGTSCLFRNASKPARSKHCLSETPPSRWRLGYTLFSLSFVSFGKRIRIPALGGQRAVVGRWLPLPSKARQDVPSRGRGLRPQDRFVRRTPGRNPRDELAPVSPLARIIVTALPTVVQFATSR
jgi:hypothetical protein